MFGISPRIREAIDSFSASVGISSQPAPDGSYSFVFSESGILSFTPSESGERLIISLSRAGAGPEAERALRLVRAAGFDNAIRKFIHAGLDAEGNMVYAFDLEERDVDLPTLDLATQRLIEAQAL